MKFEWDDRKNALNQEKHGCNFADVPEMFLYERLEMRDDRKDYGESRFIVMGYISNRAMVAVITIRGTGTIRIISLRKANNREKERFEKVIRDRLGKG